jgi:protein-disulfide isomerase
MTGIHFRRLALATALALPGLPALAQALAPDTAKEILQELRAIRGLLERQQAGAPAAAAPAGPPPSERVSVPFGKQNFALGRADAPLVMVEYTDYECPFCRAYHVNTFDQLRRDYIDTGKLRYVSRDFPLEMHRNAPRAAAAARCGADQGKFWELRHTLIVNANKLEAAQLPAYALEQKLDLAKFTACLKSGRHDKAIEADMAEGRNAGISGTPTFVIGRVVKGQLEGVRLVGAQPYGAFQAKLDELLKRPEVD